MKNIPARYPRDRFTVLKYISRFVARSCPSPWFSLHRTRPLVLSFSLLLPSDSASRWFSRAPYPFTIASRFSSFLLSLFMYRSRLFPSLSPALLFSPQPSSTRIHTHTIKTRARTHAHVRSQLLAHVRDIVALLFSPTTRRAPLPPTPAGRGPSQSGHSFTELRVARIARRFSRSRRNHAFFEHNTNTRDPGFEAKSDNGRERTSD